MKNNHSTPPNRNHSPGLSIAVLFCLFFLKQTLVFCSVPFDFISFCSKGSPTSHPAMPDPCDGPIEIITCGSSQTIELVGGGAGWNLGTGGFKTPGAEQVTSNTYAFQIDCPMPFPPDGAATVACPDDAVPPIPPASVPPIDAGCPPALPYGPFFADVPDPVTCEGTRTYSYIYNDCMGNFVGIWNFVYTIEMEGFLMSPNLEFTVSCLEDADSPPPSPIARDACGNVVEKNGPFVIEFPFPITCEGTRSYVWFYTDCAGNEAQWYVTYYIEREGLSNVPYSPSIAVACPSMAVEPVPPIVFSDCGEILDVEGPFMDEIPECEGIVQYTYVYSDCTGDEAEWTVSYFIERSPFFVPVTDAALVSCPDDTDVVPVPPVLLSNCGEVMVPTMTVTPKPICEGSRTYSFHYEDCAGNTGTWNFIYTVEREPFMVPVTNAALVACPDDTDVVPIPPVLLSNCGEVMVPTMTVTPKPVCEGSRTYSFTYTDCEGNTDTWNFIYTVEYEDFVMPVSIVGFVDCPNLAFEPEPVSVKDNCGNLLVPTGPVIFNNYDANGCEVKRIYEWTYTDCEGNSHKWSWAFLFQYNEDFVVPADEEAYVTCLAHAVPPQHITVYDACGYALDVAVSGVAQDIAPSGCTGWRRYTYTYIDCGGHSHSWNFTYHINDNEGPLGTCPSSSTIMGGVSVNVSDLQCKEDVPCPDDHDFLPKVEELLEAGGYFDVCDGKNLVVKLDSWSELWECSDPDGDGVFSFGRTFYFVVVDACGNEYPSLCEVTYSGNCQPLETFRASDWGVPGDLPGNALALSMTDLDMIDGLIGNTPLVIGGLNRSLSISEAQCVVDLLPGTGGPSVLANCHQVNCNGASCNPMGNGGIKNSLAANAIALTLNLRYNRQYKGLAMNDLRNQSLGCMDIHECILDCSATSCQLRFFDENGTVYYFPFTLGGLLDMANKFLDGGLSMSAGQKTLYGTALNQSLMDVNDYWARQPDATCPSSAGVSSGDEGAKQVASPDATIAPQNELDFELAPNPAGSEVVFTLSKMVDNQAVVFELYNTLGQLVLRRDFGTGSQASERIELQGVQNGLYFAKLKIGSKQLEKRLVVGRD